MKKIIASLAAVAAVTAVAAPAAAQPWDYGRHGYDREYRDHDRGGWQNINQRQARIDRRIDQGVRRGQLTRREADQLRREFWGIARLEQRYRHNGLSSWERADLDRRFDRLEARLRWERQDNQYGYNGWR